MVYSLAHNTTIVIYNKLIYTGVSRAKKSLTVIGAEKTLPMEWLTHFKHAGRVPNVKIPKILHIETGLGDIALGQYLKKNENSDIYVERLQKSLEREPLGLSLSIDSHVANGNYCIKQGNLYWAWFAKDFTGGLVKSLAKNVLIPQRAILSQVVRWTSEEGQETWVPLFRLEFRRE